MAEFHSGSMHSISYVGESVFGTTPVTPDMVTLRHTSCSLVLSKDSFQSQELRDDRQISDFRHGTQRVQGDIGIEMSYGEFDPFLESAFFGTWTADVLKAGVTRKSFTIERRFSDIAQYVVFKGCVCNTFNLSLRPNAIVTGGFGVMGLEASYSGTSLKASPTASQTNSPYDSFTGVIKEGGSTIAIVTGLELSIQNNLDPTFVLGSNKAVEMIAGRSNVTGTLSAYFKDLAMLNKFINETESSIEFTLGNGTSKSYTFLIPRIKYSGADNAVSNEGAVIISMPFQSLLDPVENTNIKVTRIPGA